MEQKALNVAQVLLHCSLLRGDSKFLEFDEGSRRRDENRNTENLSTDSLLCHGFVAGTIYARCE